MTNTDERTLRQALEETYRKRWAGTRSEKTTMSQAEAMLGLIAQAFNPKETMNLVLLGKDPLQHIEVGHIDRDEVRAATALCYEDGLSPATVNKRLNCLSAMGISVEGCRVKVPKTLKWWLRPEMEKEVLGWLLPSPPGNWRYELAHLIQWTTKTGLRIEESLRLEWSDFSPALDEVTVPGTKTADAQATLALASEVSRPLGWWQASGPKPFALTYEEAHAGWQKVRDHFGFDNPTATLKALRRSAARYLHYDLGMPLDMVRQYLRHENIETTMGYLRLTGGVSLEEQRRYLG